MRLIDADALRDKFNYLPCMFETHEIVHKIDNAPTIDPVKHAMWYEMDGIDVYSGNLCCTACNKRFPCFVFGWPAYCPNCGAKMENENAID